MKRGDLVFRWWQSWIPMPIRKLSTTPSPGMTMPSAPFACFCKSWSMRSFPRVERPAFANRSKWPGAQPKDLRISPILQALNSQVSIEIDPKQVKRLREKTNAGFMDCKRALAEAGGDFEKSETILRTKGIAGAGKKPARVDEQ